MKWSRCSNTLNRKWIIARCTDKCISFLPQDVIGNLQQFFARTRVLSPIRANYRRRECAASFSKTNRRDNLRRSKSVIGVVGAACRTITRSSGNREHAISVASATAASAVNLPQWITAGTTPKPHRRCPRQISRLRTWGPSLIGYAWPRPCEKCFFSFRLAIASKCRSHHVCFFFFFSSRRCLLSVAENISNLYEKSKNREMNELLFYRGVKDKSLKEDIDESDNV